MIVMNEFFLANAGSKYGIDMSLPLRLQKKDCVNNTEPVVQASVHTAAYRKICRGASLSLAAGFVFYKKFTIKNNKNMRKTLIIVVLALTVLISVPSYVSAETKSGIKPGSFWYGFDIAIEKIDLFFTFNSEGKARKALKYANERLAEAEEVADDNNMDAVKMAVSNYESNVAFATEKSKNISEKEKAEALLTLISDNTSKHQEILLNIFNRVPEEAKEAITRAIESSKKGHEEALQKVAELRGEVEQLQKEIADLKEGSKEDQTNEIEKLKAEIEGLKNKKVSPPLNIGVKETPKQTGNQEKSTQQQNYDPELLDMIAKTKERIGIFSDAVSGTAEFISIIRGTMNKYSDDSPIQSSGQELINENNNLSTISKQLVSIENQRVNKLSSYLGLGVLPSVDEFYSITRDYDNYYKRYENSNARIDLLMRTFVANEKSILQSKIAKERAELDELKKLLSQEITARAKRLTELKEQIEAGQEAIRHAGEGVAEAGRIGIVAEISRRINPLIDEYNALLGNNSGKIYSPVKQTYLRFEADQFGRGGTLYDPNGSTYYTFDCDQWGNCSIYGQ